MMTSLTLLAHRRAGCRAGSAVLLICPLSSLRIRISSVWASSMLIPTIADRPAGPVTIGLRAVSHETAPA